MQSSVTVAAETRRTSFVTSPNPMARHADGPRTAVQQELQDIEQRDDDLEQDANEVGEMRSWCVARPQVVLSLSCFIVLLAVASVALSIVAISSTRWAHKENLQIGLFDSCSIELSTSTSNNNVFVFSFPAIHRWPNIADTYGILGRDYTGSTSAICVRGWAKDTPSNELKSPFFTPGETKNDLFTVTMPYRVRTCVRNADVGYRAGSYMHARNLKYSVYEDNPDGTEKIVQECFSPKPASAPAPAPAPAVPTPVPTAYPGTTSFPTPNWAGDYVSVNYAKITQAVARCGILFAVAVGAHGVLLLVSILSSAVDIFFMNWARIISPKDYKKNVQCLPRMFATVTSVTHVIGAVTTLIALLLEVAGILWFICDPGRFLDHEGYTWGFPITLSWVVVVIDIVILIVFVKRGLSHDVNLLVEAFMDWHPVALPVTADGRQLELVN